MIKVLKSYDNLINSNFQRILNGKHFDEKFKIYDQKFLNEMIFYYQNREEYEKCQFLLNYIKKRFDHKKNYTLNERVTN
jgi:hypothetical protein